MKTLFSILTTLFLTACGPNGKAPNKIAQQDQAETTQSRVRPTNKQYIESVTAQPICLNERTVYDNLILSFKVTPKQEGKSYLFFKAALFFFPTVRSKWFIRLVKIENLVPMNYSIAIKY